MPNISDIQADKALQSLLKDKVVVQTSETTSSVLKVYANYERPNVGLADDFISCYYNGQIQSRTKPLGLFIGNLALSVFCKASNDNTITAKEYRIQQLVKQVETLVHCKSVDYNGLHYYFELTPTPITPTTVSTTTGYATTVLNVTWRTNQ
jgi:hypothetical protein